MPSDRPRILLTSSPHVFSKADPRKIMLAVILALLPTTVYGIVLFGLHALLLVLVCVASAVLSEWLFQLATRQKTRIGDLSAVVTGLLCALILPPSLPLWMGALGSVFAIIVAKEFFGGLGQNPFNPALSGRAVLLMSFPAAMTTWHRPFEALVDASTQASPLNVVKLGGSLADAAAGLGLSSPRGIYWTLFLGNRAGSVGESSILLILVGAAILLALGVIQYVIPLAMIGTTALLSWILGMDPLFGVLSGGLVFGAVFMATDYSSGATTPAGKWAFGIGCGAITVLIRKFGGFPEGITYAILIMNAIAPFLDRMIEPKYGLVKPPKKVEAKKEAAK